MVNSVMLVDQYNTYIFKTVQVLLHAIVHPEVCIDPTHEGVPKLHFHILIWVEPLTCIIVTVEIHLEY